MGGFGGVRGVRLVLGEYPTSHTPQHLGASTTLGVGWHILYHGRFVLLGVWAIGGLTLGASIGITPPSRASGRGANSFFAGARGRTGAFLLRKAHDQPITITLDYPLTPPAQNGVFDGTK